MIKITKPEEAPAILVGRGRTKQAEHCAAYEAGQREFTFDASIYSHSTVKEALIIAQHGKCCFCERKIGAEGDVEHFRPKAGFRQANSTQLEKPGYYWLAYEWANLLWACPICNQRHKQTYFPIRNPAARSVCHQDDLAQEEPLLINPAETDPAPLIGFRLEVAYPIDDNAKAKATIEMLGLNRQNLIEDRRKRLEELSVLREVLRLEEQLLEEQLAAADENRALLEMARLRLQQATLDSAKFAALARADAAGENIT